MTREEREARATMQVGCISAVVMTIGVIVILVFLALLGRPL